MRKNCTCVVEAALSDPTACGRGPRKTLQRSGSGERWYAARVNEIVETINDASLFPLPFMPPMMVGCTTYKGSPLPVLDLRRSLGGSAGVSEGRETSNQIVIMKKPTAPASGFWSTILERSRRC